VLLLGCLPHGEAAVPEGMRRLEKNHQVLRNERGGYPEYFHDT
jgi:hypothetical protein